MDSSSPSSSISDFDRTKTIFARKISAVSVSTRTVITNGAHEQDTSFSSGGDGTTRRATRDPYYTYYMQAIILPRLMPRLGHSRTDLHAISPTHLLVDCPDAEIAP